MTICIQNIVWICITVVAVLLAVELTRSQTRRGMDRTCRAICAATERTRPPPAAELPPPSPSTAAIASLPAMPAMASFPPMSPRLAELFPTPNNFAPLGWPINQITHGPVEDFRYVGYVFPKKGQQCGEGKRFPLYARRNLYQSFGYDYMIRDNSRNHVRVNIELPRGVTELQTNDEIPIVGEVCKFIVHIDIPADQSWQAFLPNPAFY